MRITKLGHCCLVIEEAGVRIMTDPGAWTPLEVEPRSEPSRPPTGRATLRREALDIDFIFITHEHQDHLHVESLKEVLRNNPKARILTNKGVGKLLEEAGIQFDLLEHGGARDCAGIRVEGFGEKHAVIYESFGQVQNTGYFFQDKFFYPGDAFYDPGKAVAMLALPVCGPWMKISESIEYAKKLRPKKAFPVHDGMLKILGPFHGVPEAMLRRENIDFMPLREGEACEC